MSEHQRHQLRRLLDEVQQEMQNLDLWESHPPSPQAFESRTPFFADTMPFNQWLQWVFIARFRAILSENHPLPAQCSVAPMAEEALKEAEQDTDHLVTLLNRFDDHF